MVSEISLGGHNYELRKKAKQGSIAYQQERTTHVARAHELGINYLDSTYDHEAESFGLALKTLGLRDQFYVSADFWKLGETSLSELRKNAQSRIERQIRMYDRDHVDIFRITPRDELNLDELVALKEVFLKLRDQGKVRFFGASGHDEQYMLWLIDVLDPDIVLIPYNFIQSRAEERLIPRAREKDIGVSIIKPFSGGRLIRAIKRGQGKLGGYPTRLFEEVHDLDALVCKGSETVAQANLKYILSNKDVAAIVPGVNSVTEIEENCGAARTKLGHSDRETLHSYAALYDSFKDPGYSWLDNWKRA
jgi:predicted aldo/keto reductase-like oxidoreductase